MSPATTTTEPTAAAADTSSANNKVKIEDVGPARKRLTITIPAETIDEKLKESMSTLAGQTVLPGFRKGHVPTKLLERRFGTSVRTETKNQLVANAYAIAIEEKQLKPVGEPEPGEGMAELELQPGKELTFTLEVEVVPTFDLPSLEGIEVKKPMLEIADKHIEDELKRQQIAQGTPSKIESDFEEGDRLGGYATVVKEGEEEPFFRQADVLILMPGKGDGGRGQVLGLMIDGLYGMLKDKRVGDTIVIEAVGPEAHERDDIRGVKLTMTFEIRVAERVEPAAPAVVAERYGLPSEQILREQIRLALEHRRDEEQASAMREQAIDQVADMVDFDLPEKMSAAQASRNLEQYRLELLYRGLSVEEVEEKLAEARDDTEAQTRDRLKRFFLLHKLGEHFALEVSEQEVNGRIAAIAAQRNIRPEKLRTELAQSGRLGEVARLIRDQKAGDRIVQQAKQVEVTAEQWNEIFTKKQKEQREKAAGKTAAPKSARSKPSAPKAPAPKASAPKASAPKAPAAKASKDADEKKHVGKPKAKAEASAPSKKKSSKKK